MLARGRKAEAWAAVIDEATRREGKRRDGVSATLRSWLRRERPRPRSGRNWAALTQPRAQHHWPTKAFGHLLPL